MSKDLRDRLDGQELDLSMDSLSVVPVKELGVLTRATHIDLSCNLLQTLPDAFCTLTHLIKIDLSKNKLTCLPIEFGALNRLQHLDLFENQLTTLPVTMFKMKNVKYLDVKSNPLNETLLKVAGDCLDDIQCRQCAKKVIAFMKEVNSEQERRLQKLLQKQREMDEERRAEEGRERQRIKTAKLAMKEKKRLDYERKHSLKESSHGDADYKSDSVEDQTKTNILVGTSTRHSRTALPCILLLGIIVILVAILVGLVLYCDKNQSAEMCRTGLQLCAQAQSRIEKFVDEVRTRIA